MMPEMVLFHPATELRARPIRDVRGIMHPLIMEKGEGGSEDERGRLLPIPAQTPGREPGQKEIGKRKPKRQKKQVETARVGMMVVMQPMLQPQKPWPSRGRCM